MPKAIRVTAPRLAGLRVDLLLLPEKFFFAIELFFVNLHNETMNFLTLLLQLKSFLVEA